MVYEIKDHDGKIIWQVEAQSLKAAVEAGRKEGANLRGAYLRGAYLRGADLRGAYLLGAYLRGAYLRGADLRGADLRGAYLLGADLQGANLRGANLRGANLRGADLRGADLRGAYLRGAYLQGAYLRGAEKYLTTPLYFLLDQPGPIRAYKLVNAHGEGPYNGGIHYEVREEPYEVKNANRDETESCGEGINLATLDWCIREWQEGYRILIAEFSAVDIAAIPIGSDGKFRVHQCRIVGEKDLNEIGLIREETTI